MTKKFRANSTMRYTLGMSRESIVFTLGILLLVIPNLGIPESWKFYFFIVSGVLLVFIGYGLRRASYLRSIKKENGESGADSFVEHNGTQIV